ncbi:MAG: PEP-CTERM sorting domain-containing protein [Desulfobacterales bacterium]|nr:MAG: PEP-CTERM sorting domain-containing protein [Desulfobacterales bacterium]
MKKPIVFVLTMFLSLGLVGVAGANLITNGDFGTGDLTGWNTSGDVRVANAGPLAAAQGMDGYYALLGLRTSDGISRLSQEFDVTGLTQLQISFDWAFDYWDNSRSAEDTFISFVRQDGTPARRITLLDLETNGTFWHPELNLAYGTYSDIIDISDYVTDDAKIVFKLVEESDWCWLSGTASVAGIDNVFVGAAPVPEPATMLLFGSGLVGLAGFKRKKFRKKQS